MDFEQAKKFLSECVRSELQDHAFGDAEVFWSKGGVEVAGGYFGGGKADVWIASSHGPVVASFDGEEARALRSCGDRGLIYRNDETGPDEFVQDQVMPGLTKEGVLDELTRSEAC